MFLHLLLFEFLVNHLQYSQHSTGSAWGCDSFNECSREWTPLCVSPFRAERTVCPPPAHSFCGTVGTIACRFHVKGSSPRVGLPGSRAGSSSCCCVPLSFQELMPVELLGLLPQSKGSRTFLEGLEQTWSHSSRDPCQPYNSGSHAVRRIIPIVPCKHGSQTLPQASGFICGFLLRYFCYLTKKLKAILSFSSSRWILRI